VSRGQAELNSTHAKYDVWNHVALCSHYPTPSVEFKVTFDRN
jgi:hypothetical protein